MEYGGCLYFEFTTGKQDYYGNYLKHRVDVDSGRSALQYVLEAYKIRRIWLPVYNCPLVGKRVENIGKIEIKWYNIDSRFRPCVDFAMMLENDAFLWVNYCGVMPQNLIDEIASWQEKTSAKIIIDNIPAYFSEPKMNVLNLYSCRKFIGVPDGGHVIGSAVSARKLPTYSTAENYLYLLKAIETGSNSVYEDYQKSEKRFTDADQAFGMPNLTKKILSCIDYEKIIKQRKKNFDTLHTILGKRNRMYMDVTSITPSVYPYLTRSIKLRERLLEEHIYVSRFWKHVLTNRLANDFEKELAEYLIPLPIDQRYEEEDMKYIASRVLELERE